MSTRFESSHWHQPLLTPPTIQLSHRHLVVGVNSDESVLQALCLKIGSFHIRGKGTWRYSQKIFVSIYFVYFTSFWDYVHGFESITGAYPSNCYDCYDDMPPCPARPKAFCRCWWTQSDKLRCWAVVLWMSHLDHLAVLMTSNDNAKKDATCCKKCIFWCEQNPSKDSSSEACLQIAVCKNCSFILFYSSSLFHGLWNLNPWNRVVKISLWRSLKQLEVPKVKTRRSPMKLCRVSVFSLIFWHWCAFEFWLSLSSYFVFVYSHMNYDEVMLSCPQKWTNRGLHMSCALAIHSQHWPWKSWNTLGSLKASFGNATLWIQAHCIIQSEQVLGQDLHGLHS